jgi:rubredoxin
MSKIKFIYMENKADTHSSTPKPKWEIPDTWAANGRCPVCGAQRLKVTHLPNYPDYLNCASCELSFDIENGGRRIHIKYLSEKYESTEKSLYDHWLDVSKVSTIITKIPPTNQNEVFISAPIQSFTDKEVWSRALRMYRLGNNPQTIQTTLKQAGATKKQLDVISSRLKKIAAQDIQKQSEKFLTVTGLSILFIALLAGSWLFFSGRLPVVLGMVTPTPVALTEETSALSSLLNLLPKGAQPSLANLPKTTVDTRRGPGPAECPSTSNEAAALFGGSVGLWTTDPQFAAWQMVSAADSYTIYIPVGMVAGYVDNQTFQMTSIHGPATIYNANFVAIMCE